MMVIILPAGNVQQMRPAPGGRPQPLLQVAGNTVLGHQLDLMKSATTEDVVIVTIDRQDQIQSWVRAHYPQLNIHIIVQEEARGAVHALWLCRDFLENYPSGLLLSTGDGLVDTDYHGLSEMAVERDAAAILFVQAEEGPPHFPVATLDDAGTVNRLMAPTAESTDQPVIVGLTYFKNGHQLFQIVDQILHQEPQNAPANDQFITLYNVMLAQGQRLITRPVRQWSDTSGPQAMLTTNARLLSIGYHSADAIERSYAEEFLVVPPVYLHPRATVHNAVIGPYATIGAGAVVKDAIVRHAIIDAGAEIQHCILEQALVGENARITGRASNLFAGDNTVVQL